MTVDCGELHLQGREERSTFPPEKMTPSFGAAPSARFGRFNEARTPGRSNGAIATALDGSMMIFMRIAIKPRNSLI